MTSGFRHVAAGPPRQAGHVPSETAPLCSAHPIIPDLVNMSKPGGEGAGAFQLSDLGPGQLRIADFGLWIGGVAAPPLAVARRATRPSDPPYATLAGRRGDRWWPWAPKRSRRRLVRQCRPEPALPTGRQAHGTLARLRAVPWPAAPSRDGQAGPRGPCAALAPVVTLPRRPCCGARGPRDSPRQAYHNPRHETGEATHHLLRKGNARLGLGEHNPKSIVENALRRWHEACRPGTLFQGNIVGIDGTGSDPG